MDIINIASYVGKDIRTRSFFRHDIEELIKNKESVTLDFSEVTFISRSVADELYNVLEDYPDIQVCNMEKDVKMMYCIVERGGKQPAHYETSDIEIVKLNTLDEMDKFFSSL